MLLDTTIFLLLLPFIITCICCHTLPPLTAPLFHLCHGVFDLLCISRSPPSVPIINRSFSPTLHLWLCKLSGERKGRHRCWLQGAEEEATKEENRGEDSTARGIKLRRGLVEGADEGESENESGVCVCRGMRCKGPLLPKVKSTKVSDRVW